MDGIRRKDGTRLSLIPAIYPQRPDLVQLSTAVQAQLARVGTAARAIRDDSYAALGSTPSGRGLVPLRPGPCRATVADRPQPGRSGHPLASDHFRLLQSARQVRAYTAFRCNETRPVIASSAICNSATGPVMVQGRPRKCRADVERELIVRTTRAARLTVAIVVALFLPPPALGNSLQALVDATAPALPAFPAGARLEGPAVIERTIELGGAADARMIIEARDAGPLIRIRNGAEVTLRHLVLMSDEDAGPAIHLEAGRLRLEDCGIEGRFEVAVLVTEGTLDIARCDITVAGEGIVALEGTRLQLAEVGIDVEGAAGVTLRGAAEATLSRLRIAGTGAAALRLDTVGAARIAGLSVPEGWATGLIAQASGVLTLDGFEIIGTDGAIRLEDARVAVELGQGRARTGRGGFALEIGGAGPFRVESVSLEGGGGLRIADGASDLSLRRVFALGHAGAALDLGAGPGVAHLAETHALARGDAPALSHSGRRVLVEDSALFAVGGIAIDPAGAVPAVMASTLLVAAPRIAEGARIVDGTATSPPLLATGRAEPLGDNPLPTGAAALTHAEAYRLLEGQPELQAALADFVAGKDPAPGLLDAALSLLPRPAGTGSAVWAVTLAPPEPGWIWAGDAVRIDLNGPEEDRRDLLPRDFPLELPSGRYRVMMDGRAAGVLNVTAPSELRLPLPDAPFLAWNDETGRLVRGPTLALRPADELAVLLAGLSPIKPFGHWSRLPDLAPRRGADRAAAAAALAAIRNALPMTLAELDSLEADDRFQRSLTVMFWLDLFALFGNPEDASLLLDLPEMPRWLERFRDLAVIALEERHGLLGRGTMMARLRSGVVGLDRAGPAEREGIWTLAADLARTGQPEAQRLLALLRSAHADDDGPALDPRGVLELSLAPPEIAGLLPGRYLDHLAAEVERMLAGLPPTGARWPLLAEHWVPAGVALAYMAAVGRPRPMPVPAEISSGEMAWIFADPIPFISAYLGNLGPPGDHRTAGWQIHAGRILCPALALRSDAERRDLVERFRAELTRAVLREEAPDFDDLDPDLQASWRRYIGFVLDFSLGECIRARIHVNPFGRDAQGEERAFFDHFAYRPSWWQRRPWARTTLARFAAGEPHVNLDGLGAYSPDFVEESLMPDPVVDRRLIEAFLTRHRLLTDAFQTEVVRFGFGSERRQFRLRNGAGDGTITIAGSIDIRPIPDGERLIVAIRHDIRSPDYGGLAAMIREADREQYEANSRLRMFEAVVLDRGGVETPMAHAGTGPDGVLYFTAPWSGDFDDLHLHIDLRFMDAAWSVSIPLWSSTVARRLRLTQEDRR